MTSNRRIIDEELVWLKWRKVLKLKTLLLIDDDDNDDNDDDEIISEEPMKYW